VTTSDRDHGPRDGRGRFLRQPANVERDAEAARLGSQGWSCQAVAERFGYSDRKDAWRGVQRALAEVAASHGASELRVQKIMELGELPRQLWEVVTDPGPLVDRVGRIVRDRDGNPPPDNGARVAAASVVTAQSDIGTV
jgi:hypothetical protein